MSATILPEMPDGPVGRRLAVQARLAILAAHGLTRLPPGILERVMCKVVSRGEQPNPSVIARYRAAVVASSTICAGHGCLPRSVATALVARMNGYGVSWFTGIKDAPFTAHAWVAVDDHAVGEPAEVTAFATVLSAVPVYRPSSSPVGPFIQPRGRGLTP
jgi:hypothetical protein